MSVEKTFSHNMSSYQKQLLKGVSFDFSFKGSDWGWRVISHGYVVRWNYALNEGLDSKAWLMPPSVMMSISSLIYFFVRGFLWENSISIRVVFRSTFYNFSVLYCLTHRKKNIFCYSLHLDFSSSDTICFLQIHPVLSLPAFNFQFICLTVSSVSSLLFFSFPFHYPNS